MHIRYDATIFLKLAKHVYAPRALRANSLCRDYGFVVVIISST